MKNNKLVLLARFATQARRFIGAVNVTKMSTDQSYAIRTILSAKASDNPELKHLAIIISQSFIINQKLLDAIEHFLSGYITVDELPKIQHFFQKFATYIHEITPESGEYRHAVNHFLADVDEHARPLCTQIIRSFYPYWAAEFSYQDGRRFLDFSNDFVVLNQSPKSLMDLWQAAEYEQLSIQEESLLNYFKTDMQSKEISHDALLVRQKMAKILTVELRYSHAATSYDYRNTVEKIRTIINMHDLKNFFLEVARDFYIFWSNHIKQLSS